MKHIPAHVTTALALLLFAVPSFSQTSDDITEAAHSKVRIVRLSQTRGEVKMAHEASALEPAINNVPIVERMRLDTHDGVAEVEFEDNSTLRLAPETSVDFPKLERTPAGGTLTSVRVLKGTVYVSLMKTPGSEFNVLEGSDSIRLAPGGHIRLVLNGDKADMAVFSGEARVETPGGVLEAAKKQGLSFSLTGQAQPSVQKGFEESAFDRWDKQSADYHVRMASRSAFGNTPYSYGMSDMMYYGSFVNAGGCGSMWRPYFTSAAWDPFSVGVWAWYQGAGYSWVSPYPWGWMPFHSGSWSYCQGTGWGWMPGGGWTGLNNTVLLNRIKGPTRPPVSPIRPPRAGDPTLHIISTRPIVRSDVKAEGFVFRKDSAGLGVPREGLGNLAHYSREAVNKGEARTRVDVGMLGHPGSTARTAGGPNGAPVGPQNGAKSGAQPSRGGTLGASPVYAPPRGPSGGGMGGGMNNSAPRPISAPAAGGGAPVHR